MPGAHHTLKRGLRAVSAAGILCLCAGAARGQVFEWGVQFGSPGFDTARRIAPDGDGGVYLAAWVGGAVGGPHSGGNDAYLARYDRDGALVWHHQFGTAAGDQAYAVVADGGGGVYVAGRTSGSLGAPHLGSGDNFLARYDATGERSWIRQFGTPQTEAEPSLASDGAGGVYLYSATQGSFGAPQAGVLDPYLVRFDDEGTLQWVRQFGSAGVDGADGGIAPDGAGGVFVAGPTAGSLGGPNAGGMDVYLARYDLEGTRTWLIQFGTTLDDWAWSCAADGAGGVYIVGETKGDLAGPLGGAFPDAFVARYDGEGNRLWVRQLGGGRNASDIASAAGSDGAGGVLIAGRTDGDLGGRRLGTGTSSSRATTPMESGSGLASSGRAGRRHSGATIGRLESRRMGTAASSSPGRRARASGGRIRATQTAFSPDTASGATRIAIRAQAWVCSMSLTSFVSRTASSLACPTRATATRARAEACATSSISSVFRTPSRGDAPSLNLIGGLWEGRS